MKRLMRRALPGLIPLLTAGVLSCATPRPISEPPRLEFQRLDVSGLSFDAAKLVLRFEVDNPNRHRVQLDRLSYSLRVNDRDVGSGELREDLTIGAREKKVVALPVRVKYAELVRLMREMAQTKVTRFVLSGTATSGSRSVPFREAGELEFPFSIAELDR